MSTSTPTVVIPVVDGVTHTGDDAFEFEAALIAVAAEIMSDPQRTVEVVIAAIVADHEIRKGQPISKVLATLSAGLTG